MNCFGGWVTLEVFKELAWSNFICPEVRITCENKFIYTNYEINNEHAKINFSCTDLLTKICDLTLINLVEIILFV